MLSLVIIGDEILSGRVVEENLAYMIRHFSAAGYAPEEARIVGDSVDKIGRAVSQLAGSNDYVVTTGGVGPTHDDVTYEGVARAFDLELEINPDMERFFTRRHGVGRLEPGARRMARLPKGAEVIENEAQRWPVVRVQNCFVLPGLPEALRDKVRRVIALLPRRRALLHGNVYLTADESAVSLWLADLQRDHRELLIGSYPITREGRYLTKISVTGEQIDAVESLLGRISSRAATEGWLIDTDAPRPLGYDERL